jgi:CheY-like chemotaxis protein
VLDVMLGHEESWRLLLRLREREIGQDIPLVVISSTSDDRKALNLGADEYVAKPIEGDHLLEMLDRLTGRRSVTRVLLVDDEEVTRYLVRQLLPRSRYNIQTARDGQEGLQQLGAARPDLILVDLNMPGMNGYEFLRRLQDVSGHADIPAVVLTSANMAETQHALPHTVSRIVSKSELTATTLVNVIEMALHQTEATGAA